MLMFSEEDEGQTSKSDTAKDSRRKEKEQKPKKRGMIRKWRSVPFRLKPLIFFCFVLYVMLALPSYFISDNSNNTIYSKEEESNSQLGSVIDAKRVVEAAAAKKKPFKQVLEDRRVNPKILKPNEKKTDEAKPFSYKINFDGKDLFIESLLTHPLAESLQDRVYLDPKLIKSKKKLVSVNYGFNNENLGGCPDWNCEFVGSNNDDADVVISQTPHFKGTRSPNQLFVYYSQESRRNSGSLGTNPGYYNLTLGFRHDSSSASPYGYTVKLAKESQIAQGLQVVDEAMVRGKTKGASWFVSHCNAQSGRDELVKALQKHMQVDIYGGCGQLNCPKNSQCEKSIDTDYHFYMALENSVCDDYITEKVWNQGYRYTVIPIVLKRNLLAPYVPPNSFIAFDDYKTVEEMAGHLKHLMENETAYMNYFEWKRDYAVIFLNGLKHDELERPWGFCQLCRLAHMVSSDPEAAKKLKLLNVPNLEQNWDDSCDSPDNKLARKLLDSPVQANDTGPGNEAKVDSGKQILVKSQMRVAA